jgi:hypothetical protein
MFSSSSIKPLTAASPFFSSPNATELGSCYGGGCGNTNQIITSYNGRVSILEPEDPDIPFKMFERIAVKNKTACMYGEAMKGALEPNLLGQVFFSEGNVQILQNGLRAGVHRMSQGKYFLPPQNVDSLMIIMRSTFLNHANFYEDEPIPSQVEALNNKVLDYAVQQLYNSSVSYEQYLRDQSTLVTPLSQPLNHDRNYKELGLNPFLYRSSSFSSK